MITCPDLRCCICYIFTVALAEREKKSLQGTCMAKSTPRTDVRLKAIKVWRVKAGGRGFEPCLLCDPLVQEEPSGIRHNLNIGYPDSRQGLTLEKCPFLNGILPQTEEYLLW